MVQMRTLVALAVLVLASAAWAVAAADPTTGTTAKGTVKSIADDSKSFVVTPTDGTADVTVKVNDDTKYTVGKKDAKFADAVKVGNSVVVTVNTDGVATTVVAKRAGRKANGG